MATMTEQQQPKAKMKKTATTSGEVRVASVTVAVPFVATAKYAQRLVSLELKTDDAQALRGVLEALELQQAKLASGKPVESSQDALRWILQHVTSSVRGFAI